MSTIYKQLIHYVSITKKENNLSLLNETQMEELENIVFDKWTTSDDERKANIHIQEYSTVQNGIEIKGKAYPYFFTPVIVESIVKYYKSITPRKRKFLPNNYVKVNLDHMSLRNS